MVLKNNNNKDYNSLPPFLAGGRKKEWKNINRLEASIEEFLAQSGISMEEYLNVILKKTNRTEFPIVLNPENATFDEVVIHAILRQRLGKTTVTKNIRYAKLWKITRSPLIFATQITRIS